MNKTDERILLKQITEALNATVWFMQFNTSIPMFVQDLSVQQWKTGKMRKPEL